jgi:hypothetical protein
MCDVFFRICTGGDIALLVESGECPENVLRETWDRLDLEYSEIVSDDTAHTHFQINRAEQYRTKANLVATAVFWLRTNYDEALAQKLKSYFKGQKLKLDTLDPFQYQRDLNVCISLSKQWLFELDKIEGVLKEVYTDKKGKLKNRKITYQTLCQTLIPMSKFMGGGLLKASETSAMEYALMFKEMQKAYQENKKQNERNG